jgi:squalene-hopene/tetraprenyl-beta-curcumene cyclase
LQSSLFSGKPGKNFNTILWDLSEWAMERFAMGRKAWWTWLVLAGCIAGIGAWIAIVTHRRSEVALANASVSSGGWNRRAAAKYLDSREQWWQDWPQAHKEQGTICISCHTAVPYAIVRPGLRQELGETEIPDPEKFLMDSVEKRVTQWSQIAPFYSDAVNGPGKTAQSHATEAVLNAVILASRDSRSGHLRPVTRTALEAAWALQEETGEDAGGWKWQDFQLAPWESAESGYQGAAMFALAAGSAPGGYASEPGVREHMERLVDYLRRGFAEQPLMSQLYVLWASSKVPGLLTATEKSALISKTTSVEESDGGWRLAVLDKQPGLRRSLKETWNQVNGMAQSDGVATGLVVLAMEESGSSPQDAALKRGVEWLERHQDTDGKWRASSLNGNNNLYSDVGLFMSDAATGYAVLALEDAPKETYKADLASHR